jgi:uncharacterized protein (DUF433 family)
MERQDELTSAGRRDSPSVLNRITVETGKRSGQPCIRGLRITVWDILRWLASGMTEDDILSDYPDLERDDLKAVYAFAAGLREPRQEG